jgi:NAD(P)-dependent dehydrogenase (short-subunit alcohol dehydrogenase family)
MKELTGKVAAITGGASGIGRALADGFAAAGMGISLADIETGPLAAAVDELTQGGVDVIGVECDVADASQVDAFAAATFDHFGTAHIVCNNAGVGGGTGRTWEVSPEGWEWTVSVNLMGVVHGIRAFVPRFVEQGDGHVVNTASLAGLRGAPMMAPYVATKHAVVGISESLHHDFTLSGIPVGVSVLCPGFIRTRIADSGRNWPAHLGANPTPEPDAPEADFIRSLVESGMDPADYAATVIDAIRADRFIVLSDPAHVAAIAARHDETRDGTTPGMAPL